MKLFRATFLSLVGASLILSGCSSEKGVNNSPSEAANSQAERQADRLAERPNILLIVADDLGFTDLGVYGSEISTPNLDQLAREGLILTDFHNQAVCAPTRAALMSGTDNHNAGGGMHFFASQKGQPGYAKGLRRDVVSFPKILSANGYQTFFAGKWHLGGEPDRRPIARGFDQTFALMPGGASHYGDMKSNLHFEPPKATYTRNGKRVESLPEDFYSTTNYTDSIISMIDDGQKSGEPWFAELSYTAPHWPLQAPQEYVDKYKGRYDAGYEVLREERIRRAKALGVIPANAPTYQRLDIVKPWDELSDEEKKISARNMEIYAAMVEVVDVNVGRLIDHLKAIGEYENTFIMFISDNGAEGGLRPSGKEETFDLSYENMGRLNSYSFYGPGWGSAGSGVMRYFKSYASEGGTRGTAFVHYPAHGVEGKISDAFASVIDIAPTVLDLANIERPETIEGRTVQPFQGQSMLPLIEGNTEVVHADDAVFGWEVFGHLGVRQGDWKLLRLVTDTPEPMQTPPLEADRWGLYNMATDPGEVNDLSEEHPEIVEKLMEAWEKYVRENNVIPYDN